LMVLGAHLPPGPLVREALTVADDLRPTVRFSKPRSEELFQCAERPTLSAGGRLR